MSLASILFGEETTNRTRIWKTYKREISGVVNHTDLFGREVEISYSVIDGCSPQSDISELRYHIKTVTYKGKKVKLSKNGSEDLYELLYMNNPENI